MNGKKIIVVGAGIGGLAAAIQLRIRGFQVEIWEKNHSPGGKLQERAENGFRWDTGPSLLTMPHLLDELFVSAGKSRADYLDLLPLPNCCRYFWQDGTVIDEDAAFWKKPEVASFLNYARGIYELSGEAYLHYPPEEFWRAFSWKSLRSLRHLSKVATFQKLSQKVDRFFSDPHYRQLFYRFATYNGSSPYRTPATFNIIPYVEQHYGGWYPRGGMARIPESIARLAEEVGVQFRFGTMAAEWKEGTLYSTAGEAERCEAVVCNQDVLAAAQGWLRATYQPKELSKLLAPPLSTSGFIIFLGVNRRYPQLSHHNIFFSSDYSLEFAELFEAHSLPSEPTIYLSITARTDPLHAPEGCDNYFVLVNAPALSSDQGASPQEYAAVVIRRLEKLGLTDLSKSIVVQKIFTHRDFIERDASHHGSLYGWASHSLSASVLRPPLQHPRDKSVYFVGGTTHPGGGIPLVLLSAKMVAEKIASTLLS